ncbi:MAG: hypothetical protein ACJ72N_07080 [Labedaea sp.]
MQDSTIPARERGCAFPGDQEHDHRMCEDVAAESGARDLAPNLRDLLLGATQDRGWTVVAGMAKSIRDLVERGLAVPRDEVTNTVGVLTDFGRAVRAVLAGAAEPVLPLDQALAPYAARTDQRRLAARIGVDLGRRRSLQAALNAAVLEHEDAWAAVLRGEVVDDPARRLCRAQLALSRAYQAAAVLYRADSPTRSAMVNAFSYLDFAAQASPVYAEVLAELAAGSVVSA